jgi:PAS domain S-box-containing protein
MNISDEEPNISAGTHIRAGEAFRQNEEKFARAFESNPAAMVLSRLPDGFIIEVNRAFEEITGYTREEALGRSSSELRLWSSPGQREDFIRELRTAGSIRNRDLTMRRKSGELIFTLASAERFTLADEQVILSTWIDITERKRAEELLSRYELLAKHSRDIVLFIERENGRIMEANEAAERAYGYSREELLRFTIHDLRAPENRAETVNRMATIDTRGILFETVHIRKDGTTFPVEVSSRGTTIGLSQMLISIVRDITERKQVEVKLLQAKEQADAANRAKSEFLAHMSHEFRTPLAGIIGMAEMLMPRLTGTEFGRPLELLRDSARSLLGIVGNVLDLSQIESGTVGLNPRVFELHRFLESCIDPFRLQAERQGLSLTYSVEESLPDRFSGDADKLCQVLRNFISNAIKYTERGSVQVRVSGGRRTAEGLELRFSIQDTGIGIAEEKQDYIFGEFTRILPPKGEVREGTGLGLAIAKRLIGLLGGTLCLESEPGEGSTFHFTVPMRYAASEESQPRDDETKHEERRTGSRPLSILVAEDTAVNRLYLETMLAEAGFSVTSVENGRLAVEAVERQRFDCVLMDIQMPELDGIEATRRIRELDRPWSALPIVALTAFAMRGDRERILEAGMDEYVTKPVDMALLKRVIGRMTSGKPAQG